MKTKLFTTISLVLTLMFTLVWTASAVFAEPACDPDYVTQSGNVISVEPTGLDDTANLQCALDLAIVYGAGAKVQLEEGVFRTGQIVANNFQGEFTGAGMEKTKLYNIPNLYVTLEDFYFVPPSVENPWPSLFSFVGGNFNFSDLSIHVVGDTPTTGWTVWGIDPPLKELAVAICILGTEANANIEGVLIEGEFMEDTLFGYNLINGIFLEGFIGEPPPPISGKFSIQDSTFRRMASGTPVANVTDANIVISHNTYEEVQFAMDGGTFNDSYLEFSHNRIDAVVGFDLYDFFTPMDIGSSFLIKNNIFRGEMGVAFEQTFGEGNQCLILGNNVQLVTDIGIYLGPGTERCIVVGGSNKTNVLDLGIDNVLTGVDNIGSGIKPDTSLLKLPIP